MGFKQNTMGFKQKQYIPSLCVIRIRRFLVLSLIDFCFKQNTMGFKQNTMGFKQNTIGFKHGTAVKLM